jgi:carboxypeptidase Q
MCLAPSVLQAQQPQASANRDQDLNAVKLEALRNPSAYSFLSELSDGIGPRLTGSAEDARAGQWALDTMRAIGLQDVHAEPWQMEKGWHRGYARANLILPFPLELSVTSYGWAGSTMAGGVEAEVAQVNSQALDEEAKRNAASWRGKILLVTPSDRNALETSKTMSGLPAFLAAARDAGAVAVLRRDRRPGRMLTHTGPLSFPGRSSTLPVLDIAEEHEALIMRVLGAGKPVLLRLDVQNEFTAGGAVSNNIVGEIHGSQHPEQVVVLGAHLDSWDLGAGSIDDGFGVAAVLGAAKSILGPHVKPKRTIRFVLFTGEEQGLLGSRAYVQMHQREINNLVCAIILDWGNGPIKKFLLGGHSELAAPFDEFSRSISDVASLGTGGGYLTYTDAYAFAFAGVPGIAAFQDSPNYAEVGHSAADTLDR